VISLKSDTKLNSSSVAVNEATGRTVLHCGADQTAGEQMVKRAKRVASQRFPRAVYDRGEEPDVRFSLANERTYLAWIRTSLALMATGVAIQAFEIGDHSVASVLASVALVGSSIGMPVQAWCGWARAERSMRERTPLPDPRGTLPLALVVIGASGLVLWSVFQ
jgi:putative membrane protein